MDKKDIQPHDAEIVTDGDEEEKLELTKSELLELLKTSELKVIQEIKTSEQFSGPVPHPEHMRKYKAIDKTLPNRFTKMAEDSLAHQQWVEKFIVVGEMVMGFLGWATPTGISFYSLYHAVGFINDGKNIEALVALVAALTTLGGAFYLKKSFVSKNNND